jgi:hypothetical protein
MLLIGHSDNAANVDIALERLPIRLDRIAFWDQIELAAQDTAGLDHWVVDGRAFKSGRAIVFASFPTFACVTNDTERSTSFMHSEWQATLTSMLWARRECVLNGHWLVGRLWLQRNRYLFLNQLSSLGWTTKLVSTNFGYKFWALLHNYKIATYPIRGVEPDCSPNVRIVVNQTHLFMSKNKIDALILEFGVNEEGVCLIGTFLWPPHDADVRLVVDFFLVKEEYN